MPNKGAKPRETYLPKVMLGAVGKTPGTNASTAENTNDENYNRNINDNLSTSVFIKPHVSSTIMST